MNTTRRQMLLAAGAAMLPLDAFAQADYPNHSVQITHGFGAGGNADVVARLITQKLQENLKQPVIVDIKAGAGGSIATNFVAKSAADGYTLVMLTGAHTVSSAIRRTQPYDPVKDFSFISTVSTFPFVVAVSENHPAKKLADLLAIAKANPGKVTFTSVGVGSTQHMVGELLASTGGVEMLHVPYRGGGQPAQAVIGGDVEVLLDTPTVALPHVKSGRLRALGVTSLASWPILRGVPPVSAALPGFEVRSWLGLAAPAGLPAPVSRKLVEEVHRALNDSGLQQGLATVASLPFPSTPAEMQTMIQSEIERWRGVVKKAGIPQQA
ncbi:MAG: tripartite tricarboxylate transporter substrate binding protein [Candidatus Protistobacter heckmanni]|nr:tripartite tricarboxylate transporter substrate binding protein [Candidatus Protistobacter heckmanni]